jgi:hypothetical protein
MEGERSADTRLIERRALSLLPTDGERMCVQLRQRTFFTAPESACRQIDGVLLIEP